MRVAITEETMTVGEAPVGLLQLVEDGEIIVKTEYVDRTSQPRASMSSECYIVASGESFCGGDQTACRAVVLIP